MPLKVQDHTIRFLFSPFVFFDGFAKRISESFSCVDTSLSRIPRLLPIDIELDDKGLFGRQRNAGVVKFKHVCLTKVKVEGPYVLDDLASSLNNFVLSLFTFGDRLVRGQLGNFVCLFLKHHHRWNCNNCNRIPPAVESQIKLESSWNLGGYPQGLANKTSSGIL